jgi:hypothetical protein
MFKMFICNKFSTLGLVYPDDCRLVHCISGLLAVVDD